MTVAARLIRFNIGNPQDLTNRFIDGKLEYLHNATIPKISAAPQKCCDARKTMEDRYVQGDFQIDRWR